MASINAPLFTLLLAFSLGTFTFAAEQGDCLYTIYVKTGNEANASTDSNISLRLSNEDQDVVDIDNLVQWGGLMGSNYTYFQKGNLDIFSGRGKCLSPPAVCAMNLTSDGSGSDPNWYCDHVQVTATGAFLCCTQHSFKVEQWLQPSLTSNGLTVIRNNCPKSRAGLEFSSNVLSSVASKET